MKVQQISIFLENRAGRLNTVTRVLGDEKVNIRALSLADTSDFGILRLIVDQPDKAKTVLTAEGFTLTLTEVIAVEVPDQPGGLADVLALLSNAGVNVEYMYAFVEKATDKAVLVFRFDDTDRAISALQGDGVRILRGEEVLSL